MRDANVQRTDSSVGVVLTGSELAFLSSKSRNIRLRILLIRSISMIAALVALLASIMAKPTNGNAIASVRTIASKQISKTHGMLSCSSLSLLGR